MTNDGTPSINVTRGRNAGRGASRRPSTSNWLLPDAATVVSTVARTARQTWLVGLGMVSLAEDASASLFQALVEEGQSWEQARRHRTEKRAQQVRALTKNGARAVEAVEERLRRQATDMLHRLGAPRREDVEELQDRVDTLSEKLERLAEGVDTQQPDDA